LDDFSSLDQHQFDYITEQLYQHGYCVLSQFINPELTQALYQRVLNLDDDEFSSAGIGREQDYQLETAIRRDETRWLSPNHPVDSAYLAFMSEFRLAINRRLFLGLLDYEAHYAHYAPGAFYKKHLDAFQGQTNRVLTTVMYLNPDWQTQDGGQLRVYQPNSDDVVATVMPEYGTFVIFLSEDFPHEVLAAHRDRYSIAGWFRIDKPLLA
jgi:SM-20-related protein